MLIRLTLICCCIALTTWGQAAIETPAAEADPALVKKVTRLNKQLAEIHSKQAALRTEQHNVEQALADLKQQQLAQEKKLQQDVTAFHDLTRKLVRLANRPQEAHALNAIIQQENVRPGLWQQLHQGIDTKLNDQRETLAALLATYQQQTATAEQLATLEKSLATERQTLQRLRQKYLKTLKIQDADLAKELNTLPTVAVTKLNLKPAATANGHILPIAGVLISSPKTGIVIQGTPGAAVPAQHAGTVLFSGPFRDFGHLLILRIADQTQLIYGGLTGVSVKVGDQITPATTLGFLPNTATPQLYLAAHHRGRTVKPEKWLPKTP